MQKKIIIMMLIMIMNLLGVRQLNAAPLFSDVTGNWAYPYIILLADMGVVNGQGDGSFHPNYSVTRAEFITMVNRAFNPADINRGLPQVSRGAWYNREIAYARAYGYLPDHNSSELLANDDITREEATYILARALKLDTNNGDVPTFKDAFIIDEHYVGSVAAMQNAGYLNGYADGTFRPTELIRRAEATVMICNGLNLNSDSEDALDVRDYGAMGDGETDDTDAINKAINHASIRKGGTVFIPGGTYLIDVDVSIVLQDNVKLQLAPDAVLQAKPSASKINCVVRIQDVEDVEVIGGTIIGYRYEHHSSDGQWGRGIEICGSSDVYIADVFIKECWGDGIYIGSSPSYDYCSSIVIEDVSADDNRRSGIAVISCKDLAIRNVILSNSNGSVPAAGLILEPNYNHEFLEDVSIENIRTINNEGYGIDICFCRCYNSSNDFSIKIVNHTDVNSGEGKINTGCPHFHSKHVEY